MNILMLVKNSEVGGVISCTNSLADGLEKKGINVVIGSSPGDGVNKMLTGKNVNMINFSSKSIFGIIGNYIKLKEIIKDNNINIIHAQNRIPALYASIYHFFHREVKYLWANHLVPIPSSYLYRITTKYGSFAIAEGIDGKDMLINKLKIPEDKVEVINLGTDLSNFKKTDVSEQVKLKESHNINKNEKVILLYGRLAPVKGHLFLLNAISQIDENRRKVLKVIFPGKNAEYRNEILKEAKKFNFENNIIFPGFIKGQDYLSISDLMVLPSQHEGFGIVNVESFAIGVPVIRTKTAGYEDMKEFCFGVDYGDVSNLSKHIEYLWDNPLELTKQAEWSKNNVSKFSQENMTEEYLKVYEKC